MITKRSHDTLGARKGRLTLAHLMEKHCLDNDGVAQPLDENPEASVAELDRIAGEQKAWRSPICPDDPRDTEFGQAVLAIAKALGDNAGEQRGTVSRKTIILDAIERRVKDRPLVSFTRADGSQASMPNTTQRTSLDPKVRDLWDEYDQAKGLNQ